LRALTLVGGDFFKELSVDVAKACLPASSLYVGESHVVG
jgi:hypothetical protein